MGCFTSFENMKLQFISLASGSSGNCYYLGNDQHGILIDAGIGVRSIKKVLKENGIAFEKIIALLITHDHADHIKSAGVLGEKNFIPVYTTEEIHIGMNKNYAMTEKIYNSRKILFKDQSVRIGDFLVTAFQVPHDGTDNVGYCIEYNDKKFVFATDLGHIPEDVAGYLSQADYLVIEANYDEEMLKNGRYSSFLKQRVASNNGHMSNRDTARYLANSYSDRLQYVFLCHLSQDNNHPELAYKTVEIFLNEQNIKLGRDLNLTVLKRTVASEMFVF